MVSQAITTKKILSLLERNQNLCEASLEYPSSKHPSTPRHLSTCEKASTKPESSTTIHKLLNQTTTELHEKDSKTSREEIEVIELFPDEKINNKLYKKSRYQPTRRNDVEKIDNID